MNRRTVNLVLAVAALMSVAAWPSVKAQTPKPTPPKSLRLYVLDCGKITVANGNSMGFKPGELVTSNMVTPCFLIVHPRGSKSPDTFHENPLYAQKSGVKISRALIRARPCTRDTGFSNIPRKGDLRDITDISLASSETGVRPPIYG